jgi:dienelactone hydrolase
MLRPTPTLLALTVALAVGLLYPTSAAVPAGPAKDQPAGKAKDQPAGKAKDQPKATPQLTPTARGQKILDDYFRAQVKAIQEREPVAQVKTLEQWQQMRPKLRQQFLEMMGLWPMPPKGDLRAVVTGRTETEKFTVENLHFQSVPGLYVTANLYIPKPAPQRAPAILYLCGHATVKEGDIAYGSKASYQRHPAWFAEHGYVALILDTLQLGEIEGIHHGTHKFNMWWWTALGYTPAGIEAWNAIRALDYLETRPEVDPKRIGVTGRSGGGATTWWVLAADDRPACFVPVAGIADLYSHLCQGESPQYPQGVIYGHCDCMYPINTYRWDFGTLAALAAPRPLLLGNSDADPIFPVGGYRRIAQRVRSIYELYNAGERFELLETKGPHKDTPELRTGAFAWMNRWLMDKPGPVANDEPAKLTPQQLRVYQRFPEDARNTTIQETFRLPARHDLPKLPEVLLPWWEQRQPAWIDELRQRSFAGWPEQPPPLNAKLAADVRDGGLRLRAYDFVSEQAVPLRLWLLTAEKTARPKLCVLNVLDEPGWAEWCSQLGPAFADALQLDAPPQRDQAAFELNQRVLAKQEWAFAALTPRGIGPTRWAVPGSAADTHIQRKFPLIGQTLDGQRVWDTRRALAVLREQPDLREVPLWLQGKEVMAGVALHAALFEPDVVRLDLWYLPPSYQLRPAFLHAWSILDVPQTLALVAPRKVVLYTNHDDEAKNWDWPLQLQRTLGKDFLTIRKVPR